jgi:putative ABC transport system permease protein
MRHLFVIAARSAWNRRLTLGLTGVAILLSVTLLLAVERLREDARSSFAQSISGVDLVVGARGSPIQLLLYAVFHLGDATQNLRWDSARRLAEHPAVAWTVPISLGDSHRGFPVIGTTTGYFEHFRYGERRALAFAEGRAFAELFETVLGAEVAERLGYRPGDRITLAHGSGSNVLTAHDDKPFVVTGILKRTGTPVDRAVHVSLEAIEAIHLDWRGGAPVPGLSIGAEQVRKFDLTPRAITAVLVGLHSRARVFAVQREVNADADEALMAILPGVALDQLWRVLGTGERVLLLVSAMVVAVGLTGLVAVILAGLAERRRELAILRANGARPRDILTLLALEGVLVTVAGILGGLLAVTALTLVLAPLIEARYGLILQAGLPTAGELKLLGLVLVVGTLASLLPAYRAYRLSLADGLIPRG